jgi:hypothetical protein
MANNLLDAITSPLTGEYRKEKPLSVKAADTAVSLTTPIDSIVEIQEELKKDEPDYLKIGMLGGVEAISLIPGIAPAARTMIRKGADMARQTDKVVEVASTVPKVVRNSEPLSSIEAAGLTDETIDAWRKANATSDDFRKSLKGRNQELQDLANKIDDPDSPVTVEDYRRRADELRPIRKVTDVPKPATYKETVSALNAGKRKKPMIGLNAEIPDGDVITARLDIDAYTDYDVWVPTLTHPDLKTVYKPTVVLKDVTFIDETSSAVKKAKGVAQGKPKAPFAVMTGKYQNMSNDEAYEYATSVFDSDEWVQAGYDPTKRGFFYDRADGQPIIAGDEVIQIGHLVLVKNAKKGDAKAFGFNEGGMAMDEQMNAVFKSTRGYALGGDVEVDPVSGNEVPPGSLPEEVRDDIPAMLSEGEYVVPADVLRYYGVKFFEDLRAQAKMGLAEMDANGRIGGEPIEEETGDVGISDEDLMVIMAQAPQEEQTVGAAKGGLMGFQDGGLNVPDFLQGEETGGLEYRSYVNAAGNTISIPFFNNEPMAVIPEGYSPAGEAVEEEVAPQAPQDDGFDAASAQRAREEIEKGREDKTIDFNNPQSVEAAVNTYYSSKPLLDFATTTGLGLIPGVAASYGIKQLEKNNLLKGINTAIDETDDTDLKEKLTAQKELLEDKDKWKKTYESKTEGLGLMDRFKDFFDFGEEAEAKQYTKPEGLTNEKWKSNSLNKWVDATNLVNSVSPDDPKAWHEAMQAQAEASREATAAAQAESGWTGFFSPPEEKEEENE